MSLSPQFDDGHAQEKGGITRRSVLAGASVAAVTGVFAGSLTKAEAAKPKTGSRPGLPRDVLTSDWSVLNVWLPSAVTKSDVFIYPSLGRAGADFDVLVGALLTDGHRVLALDPLTVDSSATSGVGLTGLANDAVGLIDRAGSQTFHVIGHAFGSRVVREMSILYPSRVRTISCLACGGQVPGTPAGLAALPECYDLSLSDDQRIQALATAFFAPGHDPTVWLSGWFPDTAAGEGAAGNPENFFLGGPQEMLIIQGSQDAVAPPGNAQELKASRAPATKLVTVYAGHALMPEQPGIIVREVRAFLDAHERKG